MKKKKKFKVLLVYPNIPGMLVVSVSAGIFTAILKKAGFEVRLFDATLYSDKASISPEKRVQYLQARKFSYKKDLGIKMQGDLIKDFVRQVEDFQPDLLAFSVVEDAFRQALALLESIKGKNIPHIIGGVFPTSAPEKVISFPQIKMIGIGEGEETLLEVAQKMRDGLDISHIPNTWLKKGKKIIKNSVGPLVNINQIPFPDYDLFNEVRFYRPMGGRIFRTIPLETTRGCPNQCTFCNSPFWNGFYREHGRGIFLRHKKIERLMEEIKFLVNKYQPQFFYIIDDTFLARPIEEIREFAKKYRAFRIPFWMNTRPETLTEEKTKLLREMNCYRISVGLECGNEEFRRNKLKRFASNKEILERMKILKKSGLAFSANNIIGFPDETRKLIFDTIEFNRKLSGYDTLTVSIFTPYHGTKLREEAIQRGYLDRDIITTHTTSSSLLKMPQLSFQEIDGLMRTFTMYVGFPKKWWPHIKIAEKFTTRGNKMFKMLSEIHRKIYLSGDQFSKAGKKPNWDELEKQIIQKL